VDRTFRAGLVIAIAGLGGCGGGDRDAPETAHDEHAAVLRVMGDARSVLLAGDGEGACRLLTRHGLQRVLGFQVDFLPTGTPVPTKRRGVPQTCEQMVRAQLRAERLPDVGPSWTPDLKAAEFEVVSLSGDNARVRLRVPGAYGPTVDFSLLKTAQGWRIDDSDAVPSGY
jgi:hypothetical protein